MTTCPPERTILGMSEVTIGGLLRSARGEATQKEFAPRVGLDRHQLCNYERGNKIPSDQHLYTIAKVLKLDYDFVKGLQRAERATMKAIRARPNSSSVGIARSNN